mmetsp:Transcript_26884/g.58462  ORF Transcript_26884/g.58462 Transcript_26884/m.58462 type:complete len:280 (+) Transcript_26884:245-1084(+)
MLTGGRWRRPRIYTSSGSFSLVTVVVALLLWQESNLCAALSVAASHQRSDHDLRLQNGRHEEALEGAADHEDNSTLALAGREASKATAAAFLRSARSNSRTPDLPRVNASHEDLRVPSSAGATLAEKVVVSTAATSQAAAAAFAAAAAAPPPAAAASQKSQAKGGVGAAVAASSSSSGRLLWRRWSDLKLASWSFLLALINPSGEATPKDVRSSEAVDEKRPPISVVDYFVTKRNWELIGLPKLFWSLLLTILVMAAFVLCIPWVLHLARRRRTLQASS